MTINEKRRLQGLLNRVELRKAIEDQKGKRLQDNTRNLDGLKSQERKMKNA